MLDLEEAPVQKRKASPSPVQYDALSKRVKLETEEDGEIVGNGNGHVAEHSNGNGEAKDEESTNGNGVKHDKHDDGPEATSPTTTKNTEATRRPSVEEKRLVGPAASGRRNFSQEEKKRGQRLFGGLLSTLSQTTSSSQQKKRLEIERRQQERAQQQRAEDDRRRAEKLSKLNHVRKIEQVKFDEQAMRTRHANMLMLAGSLRTTSEPRLYYRPYDLTREQERTIDAQLRTARDTIDREGEDFKIRKEKRLRELGAFRPPSRQDNSVGEPKPLDYTNRRVSASSLSKMHVDKDHDDHADEMVHDEEDTVLY